MNIIKIGYVPERKYKNFEIAENSQNLTNSRNKVHVFYESMLTTTSKEMNFHGVSKVGRTHYFKKQH